MQLAQFLKSKWLLTTIACSLSFMAMAQSNSNNSEFSQVAILFIIMALVLAFVIGGLGQVLLVLSRQLVEKQRKDKSNTSLTMILVVVLSMFAHVSFAQTTVATTVEAPPNYGGMSASNYYMFVAVLAIELMVILALSLSIRGIYRQLLPQKVTTSQKETKFSEWWERWDKKLFTKAVPVEQEADVMLDHNYDGIRELDNALPPWWKYGFYITIFIGVIYLLNFHVFGTGKNPTQEYAAEMERANIEKEIYEANNKDKVDESNIPMADASGLAAAKAIFEVKCWACHGKGGEGGAGPNLTDDYWLHKGSLNDIYHTIKVGYPDKGMQSWSSDMTPKEISYLASYIKTLHGTNPPNQKSPQGELYVDSVGKSNQVGVTGTKPEMLIKKDSSNTATKK